MVAYRELARGQLWREQKPETLCSLRQKVWSLVVLSLKEQKSVPMTLARAVSFSGEEGGGRTYFHTRSSEAIAVQRGRGSSGGSGLVVVVKGWQRWATFFSEGSKSWRRRGNSVGREPVRTLAIPLPTPSSTHAIHHARPARLQE